MACATKIQGTIISKAIQIDLPLLAHIYQAAPTIMPIAAPPRMVIPPSQIAKGAQTLIPLKISEYELP